MSIFWEPRQPKSSNPISKEHSCRGSKTVLLLSGYGLLQLVSETEEPVAVLFDIAETEGQFEVEILAAPTTGGHRTEAIFCGIVRRKRQQIAWHLPAK